MIGPQYYREWHFINIIKFVHRISFLLEKQYASVGNKTRRFLETSGLVLQGISRFYNVRFVWNILILKNKVCFLKTSGSHYLLVHSLDFRITEISATSMWKCQN